MNLEEVIRQRLAKATETIAEGAGCDAPSKETKSVELNDEDDKIVVNPKKETKVELTKESEESASSTPSQVSALLEAEGLSEEFKTQAVAIFEAAVADRVMQIKEDMEKEFAAQLEEAKAEIESDIDGFVTEAVRDWTAKNEVAIKQNFKTQMYESLVDGMRAVFDEHNIDISEGQVDALETAMTEVAKLEEAVKAADQEKVVLEAKINSLTAEKIQESFRAKMSQTEFDRFSQLTESIKFSDATQYEKQLSIVLENFGMPKTATKVETITETVTSIPSAIVESVGNSSVNKYADFIARRKI